MGLLRRPTTSKIMEDGRFSRPYGPGAHSRAFRKPALRHQAWGAASQSRGSVSLPPDAAVQQQPQPVVAEVAEAMPDPLHLFDQQVDGLGEAVGAAVGGVKCEDLGLPCPDGAGEPGQLSDLDAITPPVEAVQGGAGRGRVRWVSCSAAVSSSLRMRYSGSCLRPRWPRVAC